MDRSSEQSLWSLPVELCASHREGSSDSLEDVFSVLVHGLNRILEVSLRLFDLGYDVLTVSYLKRDVVEVLVQLELHIALLEEVVVDGDLAS